jgi:hypothetical protein
MKVNWLKENVRHSLVSKGQGKMDKIPPLRGSSRSSHEATYDEKSEKLLTISPYKNHANVPLTISAVLATNRPGPDLFSQIEKQLVMHNAKLQCSIVIPVIYWNG